MPPLPAWVGGIYFNPSAQVSPMFRPPDGELIAAACGDPEPIVRRVAVESPATLVRTPPLAPARLRDS